MQRDGSIGPDNMGSDSDHNSSHFNGVRKIKAEFKYVEDSLGGTKKETVNPITTFEFCCERVGKPGLWPGVRGRDLHLTAFFVERTQHSKRYLLRV